MGDGRLGVCIGLKIQLKWFDSISPNEYHYCHLKEISMERNFQQRFLRVFLYRVAELKTLLVKKS